MYVPTSYLLAVIVEKVIQGVAFRMFGRFTELVSSCGVRVLCSSMNSEIFPPLILSEDM